MRDEVFHEEAVRRERQLTQTKEYWGWIVDHGSAFYRHGHKMLSAERIVYRLANNDIPVATGLQKQLTDE
ncbi:hypothetical protein N7508_000753 [Penicillium antarcticum]|uniref:uncharacterized protein n=1 Tax=Penicillium antarcticum TaxID=416450 RepID=UPI00238BA1F0|nr:uncharacterized protein N7508_000753 [Penicillium antarcticum]KAJ5320470.1 hypothetical protein N7508_000753 [Penicillium antarcticum]